MHLQQLTFGRTHTFDFKAGGFLAQDAFQVLHVKGGCSLALGASAGITKFTFLEFFNRRVSPSRLFITLTKGTLPKSEDKVN